LPSNKENTISNCPSEQYKIAKGFVQYDPENGYFFVVHANGSIRRIFPDEEGYVMFHKKSTRYKIRASRVAYELGNATEVPEGKVVLHRNLDTNDYRLRNLAVVPKEVHKKIKEAHMNLSGFLRIQPHQSDAFCYVVHYREDSRNKFFVLQDIVVAKQTFLRLQLKYAKLLNKYCVFD